MKTKDITINVLFEKVWVQHWNTERFKRSGWALEARRSFDRLIAPAFGEKPQGGLKASQIRAWHLSLSTTPIQANRALGVLSKMLSFAEELELRPQGCNVARLVKPFKERSRKRFATPEEIQKLGAILEREKATNPRAVAFIYLLMFSGARPRSIERSTWNQLEIVAHESVNFGVLTFDGKSTEATGDQEQVVIPPQVLELLEPSFAYDSLLGIKMPKDFWQRIRREAGCVDLQIRDLRRTFATVGLSNGVSLGLIGELLNHHSSNTTKIYAKLMNTQRLDATKEIADQLSKILKGA